VDGVIVAGLCKESKREQSGVVSVCMVLSMVRAWCLRLGVVGGGLCEK
jgi:hypothetical protein